MPKKIIPCADCDEEKEKLKENDNVRVIGCEPVPGRDGWCEIEWEEIWDE